MVENDHVRFVRLDVVVHTLPRMGLDVWIARLMHSQRVAAPHRTVGGHAREAVDDVWI
jgi:hypothetical protein